MGRLLATAVVAQLTAAVYAGCATMANSHNTEFTVKVELGTPAQELNLVADAGSSDVVVDSTICENCGGSQHHKYNFEKSKTGTNTGKVGMIAYGQGEVECALVKDTVKVAGETAHKVPIAVMAENGLVGFNEATYDGVMGLGPSATSTDGSGETLLAKMGQEIFSICFGGDGERGRLEIGSGIGSGYGESIKATGSEHWAIPMEGVKVGAHEEHHSGKAIIDSGTSLIGVPSSVHSFIHEHIGKVHSDCSNVASLPDVKLQLGGQEFLMSPHHYVVRIKGLADDLSDWHNATTSFKAKLVDSPFDFDSVLDSVDMHKTHKKGGACTSAFFANGGDVILGIPFMRAYAVKFNRGTHHVSFSHVHSSSMCSSCSSEEANGSAASTTSLLTPPNPEMASVDVPLLPLDKIKLPWYQARKSQVLSDQGF